MATYYRHPDLRVRLSNPSEARIFLDDWRTWLPERKPIELRTQALADDEAVYLAFQVFEQHLSHAQNELDALRKIGKLRTGEDFYPI